MRKFKFIGHESSYSIANLGIKAFNFGEIYEEDYKGRGCMSLVGDYAFDFPKDWQEVFDEEKVQLTKTEKIVLIDFLNDHFEEFCERSFEAVNIIDKIEKL